MDQARSEGLTVEQLELVASYFCGEPAIDIKEKGGFEKCNLSAEVFAARVAGALSERAMAYVANHMNWCRECKQKGR